LDTSAGLVGEEEEPVGIVLINLQSRIPYCAVLAQESLTKSKTSIGWRVKETAAIDIFAT
jgi:hypothetical protein